MQALLRGGKVVPGEERGGASTSHDKKSKRRRGEKNKAARPEQEEGFRSPGATGAGLKAGQKGRGGRSGSSGAAATKLGEEWRPPGKEEDQAIPGEEVSAGKRRNGDQNSVGGRRGVEPSNLLQAEETIPGGEERRTSPNIAR